ncbi:hypothetical protein IQ260_15905 [Leptolyngbya cf. ectocarpi LEGE 11479]|uniref:Uncharacterized protein n=1 Tax=Leptolyngbya cf. ectocarpi LEGE 11479 TaxID=1828722 RepID=A0A929FA03_LEPEC|nr:hypothetical protein [Leptolyngbya ectocarpi]MBE9068137.1 hypothetical protein [Leptolyngbya cf. ectocarpi LEGE 11479]
MVASRGPIEARILKKSPVIEIEAGPWLVDQEPVIPDIVLAAILHVLRSHSQNNE